MQRTRWSESRIVGADDKDESKAAVGLDAGRAERFKAALLGETFKGGEDALRVAERHEQGLGIGLTTWRAGVGNRYCERRSVELLNQQRMQGVAGEVKRQSLPGVIEGRSRS